MRPTLSFLSLFAITLVAAGCSQQDRLDEMARADGGGGRNGGDADAATLRTQTTQANAHDGVLRHALAFPTGDPRTSVVLVEKLAPREALLNRPYDYRIRVTNLTDAPLAGVVVRERAVENFKVTKADPAPRDADGWHLYDLGDLPPRGARTVEVSGVPTGDVGQLGTSIAVDYRPTLRVAADVVNPVLKLTKEGPEEVDICEGIRYRYVVTNTGTGTERDVTVEDVLPEGVTTDDGKKTVSLRIGDVPQSTSKEVTVRVKPTKTGRYTSAAVARAPGAADVRSAEVSTTVRQPALDVAVTGPKTEYLNKVATYTVTVKNTGDAPARRTTLALDTLEQAGEVASVQVNGGGGAEPRVASPAEVRSEGTDLDTIAPGQSKTVTVAVRATRGGPLTLRAVALAGCVSPVSGKTTTEIRTLPALRLEVVDLDDPIRVGDSVVYRVTVKNQGTGPDKNVRVTATLPPELTYVTGEGPTAAKVDGRTVLFDPLATLGAGEEAVWRVQAKATRAGDVRFRIHLKSESMTEPAQDAEPTRLY